MISNFISSFLHLVHVLGGTLGDVISRKVDGTLDMWARLEFCLGIDCPFKKRHNDSFLLNVYDLLLAYFPISTGMRMMSIIYVLLYISFTKYSDKGFL